MDIGRGGDFMVTAWKKLKVHLPRKLHQIFLLHFTRIINYFFREFAVMFAEADKNRNGKIDFDEFVDMMLPGANTM